MRGREVVVVEAVRTPVGRGHPEKGVYRDVHPNVLLGATFVESLARSGIQGTDVDAVVVGCAQQFGEQMSNPGRHAWLQAGLPYETPSTTVDCRCGSGQQAVTIAAAQIASGMHDVVVAGGVEHMGHIPIGVGWRHVDELGTPWPEELLARYPFISQGLAAELVAERWGLTRGELDQLAFRSHERAAHATDAGYFEREILPIPTPDGLVSEDQGIRRDTTLERLAALEPAFKADGVVTAASSSQISDGAAALVLMSREHADELGVKPRARIVDATIVGVDPIMMLTGPIDVTRQLLERNDLEIGDIDLFEVNEAFAPVVAAWSKEVGADLERTNVNGGAIALGHPLGSTGARLLTTLLHELERREEERGLVAMCCGGGLGTGTLI
jgi:acetyl-CoA acetyltransferase family protein